MDTVLAGYVKERVVIRYTPSDITSIRVFHKGEFLCQPVCPELSNQEISIKEIQTARRQRRNELRKQLKQRKSLVDAVIDASKKDLVCEEGPLILEEPKPKKLKLYENE